MYALTEAQYQIEAEPILRKVFVNDNPFGQPFSSNITQRRIIYYYKYGIEPPLTDALVAAASSVGDSGFYWSVLWRDKDVYHQTDEINHCYVPFSEFVSIYVEQDHEFFQKIQYFFILENVIYSPQGKWGIMFSHESFGLLGGIPEFVEIFEKLIPDLNQQVYGFIDYFVSLKSKSPDTTEIRWLPGLLTHVYGQEKAEEMLLYKGKKASDFQ
jgi:hypothetical protein